MILTPTILRQIIAAIEEDPERPLILPDHAYGPDDRVVVYVDRIPMDLHRHLHNLLIRPLLHAEEMHQRGGVRNVNPHLFQVVTTRKALRTHCWKGHEYTPENEAPPNSRGYRCLTCLRDSLPERSGKTNASKTHCPHNHEYTPENTRVGKDGKRRCITCINDRSAARRKTTTKENS